jgi:hypothetical protein
LCELQQHGDSGDGARGGSNKAATKLLTSCECDLISVGLARQLVALLLELLADKGILGEAKRPAAWMQRDASDLDSSTVQEPMRGFAAHLSPLFSDS